MDKCWVGSRGDLTCGEWGGLGTRQQGGAEERGLLGC